MSDVALRATSCLALVVLTACASQQPVAPTVNLQGYPPAFKQGHADGCASAKSIDTRQDAARMKTDALYAQGWHDGFSICKSR